MQWISSVAFTIAITPLLVPGGRFADRVGQQRALRTGLLIFTAASLLAIVPSVSTMIPARAFQGVGAALLIPASLAALATQLPESKRPFGVAIWGTTAAGLQGLGPGLGGLFVAAGAWQGVFLVSIPIALFVWWITSFALPNRPADDAGGRDTWGGITFGFWTVALTLALIQGGRWGWDSAPIVGLLAASAVGLMVFLVVETRADDPMLDLRLFRIRAFTGSVSINFVQNAAFVMLGFLMSLYLQLALDYGALQAGAFFVALSATAVVVGPFSGWLVERLGLRGALVLGVATLATGFFLASRITTTSSTWATLLAFVAIGAGATTLANVTAIGMATSVDEDDEGAASGVFNTAAMLASSIGLVLGSLLFSHAALGEFADLTAEVPQTTLDQLSAEQIDYMVTGEGSAPTIEAVVPPIVSEAAQDGFVHGMSITMLAVAGLVALTGVLALVLLPGRVQTGDDRPATVG